jgi:glycine oxidase
MLPRWIGLIMKSYDVAIAGNGILGCATALELIRADPGLNIAVIGQARRPWAASTAAGAMLGCFAELNHRSLSSAPGKAKLDLSIRALDAWPSWLEELNADLPDQRQLAITEGTYVILNSRGGRLDSLNYQAIIDALEAYGRSYESVPRGEVPNLNPSVESRPLAAVYLPEEGAIDARHLLDAVVSVASRHGVTFIDDEVIGWKQDGSRARCAITESAGEISADRFLVAAGARSNFVLHDLAEDSAPLPPVVSGKGISVTCRSTSSEIANVVRTPNRSGGCGLHLVPGRDGTVYLGATNELLLQPNEYPTIGMVHFLLDCAIQQLDNALFMSEVLQWHVGNRPGSIDGFPLIGKVWQDNVWMLSGTYRDGFHCSPVLARQTADTMLGGNGILGDHCFAPLRKPLRVMNSDEAIDEVTLHVVSQLYEYEVRPNTQLSSGIQKQVRADTRATYDRLETDLGLAPEILETLNWGDDKEANIGFLRDYLKRAE